MESRIVNSASGNTIKEIKKPIRWLFNHYRDVVSFDIKPLQDSGGLLIAQLDNGTRFRMTWADYRIMNDRLFHSRAWSNHFFQVKVYSLSIDGKYLVTRIIK
jgi:hypothetical protein